MSPRGSESPDTGTQDVPCSGVAAVPGSVHAPEVLPNKSRRRDAWEGPDTAQVATGAAAGAPGECSKLQPGCSPAPEDAAVARREAPRALVAPTSSTTAVVKDRSDPTAVRTASAADVPHAAVASAAAAVAEAAHTAGQPQPGANAAKTCGLRLKGVGRAGAAAGGVAEGGLKRRRVVSRECSPPAVADCAGVGCAEHGAGRWAPGIKNECEIIEIK